MGPRGFTCRGIQDLEDRSASKEQVVLPGSEQVAEEGEGAGGVANPTYVAIGRDESQSAVLDQEHGTAVDGAHLLDPPEISPKLDGRPGLGGPRHSAR